MGDPTTAAAGDSSSAGITNEQLNQQIASVAGMMETFQASLKSLTESVNKIQTESGTDSDSGYLVRTSLDPGDPQRNVQLLGQMALEDAITFRKSVDALVLRKLSQDTDHHGAIPPIAPRSASGPGTSAS